MKKLTVYGVVLSVKFRVFRGSDFVVCDTAGNKSPDHFFNHGLRGFSRIRKMAA